jgi:hypothetical protein
LIGNKFTAVDTFTDNAKKQYFCFYRASLTTEPTIKLPLNCWHIFVFVLSLHMSFRTELTITLARN